jgi:hypothetical protein
MLKEIDDGIYQRKKERGASSKRFIPCSDEEQEKPFSQTCFFPYFPLVGRK